MISNSDKSAVNQLDLSKENNNEFVDGGTLSPRDKARRQKIFEKCFGMAESKVAEANNLHEHLRKYSSLHHPSGFFQQGGTLALEGIGDEVFDYQNLSSKDQSTLFNFPHRPIEQEALKQEELEIEKRASKKRKATAGDASITTYAQEIELQEIYKDLSRKPIPFFQRVNVGEETFAGVSLLLLVLGFIIYVAV